MEEVTELSADFLAKNVAPAQAVRGYAGAAQGQAEGQQAREALSALVVLRP